MRRKTFKLILAYKGTAYSGWQRQTSQPTVQGMLEYAISKYFGREIKTTGASRTDAGVHAYGQTVSFQVETKLEARGVMSVLNGLLPPDIRIMRCGEKEGFNARWNVRKKFYRYLIHNSPAVYPVLAGLCWQMEDRLDAEKMRSILPLFKGEKNYFSFSSAGTQYKDYLRTVDSIKIKKQGKWIITDFTAKSFLYNMIRKIMSALVSYAQGGLAKKDVERMFSQQDRSISRHTAPAGGLYLVKIIYGSADCGLRIAEEKRETEED